MKFFIFFLSIALSSAAYAGKMFLTTGTPLTGYEVSITGDGYCSAGSDAVIRCVDFEITLKPIWTDPPDDDDDDDGAPYPPSKSNAFETSCYTCHKKKIDEGESKFFFENWKAKLHDEHDDVSGGCVACHRNSVK